MEITLKIVGQADDAQIEAMRAKIEEMGPALKKALDSGGFAAAAKAAEQFSQAQMLAAKAAIEEAKATLQAQKAATELASAQKFAERAGYELAAAQRITAREASAVAAGLRQTGDAAREAGGAGVPSLGGLIDKIKGIHPATAGALAGIGLLAVGVTQLGGAVSSFLSSGVSLNAQFETFETQLGTLMGSTDAAKERIAELSAFGAATPFELPQLVEAEKVMIGFGLTTGKSLKLAQMSASEMRTVIGDVAAGTGKDFAEIALTFGKFSAGATGEAISRLQELGVVTREELAAQGVQFSKSGALISPLPVAFEAATKLAQEKFGGGMNDLSATFEGKMSTLSDTWGQIKRAVTAPIFDAAKAGLDVFLPALSNLATVAQTVSDAFGERGVVGGFRELGSALDTLLGNQNEEMFTWFGDLGFAIRDLQETLTGAFESGGIEGLISKLGELSGIDIQGTIDSVVSGAKDIGAALAKVDFGALLDKAKEIGATIGDVFKWMAENPAITKTIGMVGALVLALAPVMIVVGPLIPVFMSLAGVLTGALGLALGPLILAVGALIAIMVLWRLKGDEIKAALSAAWESIKAATVELVSSIAAKASELWANITATWDGLMADTRAAWDDIKALPGLAWNWILAEVDGLVGDFRDLIRKGMEWIQDKIDEVWSAIPEDIREDLIAIGDELTRRWEEFKTTVRDKATEIYDLVAEKFMAIRDAIVGPITEFIDAAGVKWAEFKMNVEAVFSAIADLIREKVASFRAAWDANVQPMIDSAKAKFDEIKQRITEALSSIVAAIREKLSGAKNQASAAAASIRDSILAPIREAIAKVKAIAGDIVTGLVNMLSGAKDKVKEALLSMVRGGLDAVKSFLGIASPSRVFAEIGEWIVLGLASGIQNSDAKAIDALANVVSKMNTVIGGAQDFAKKLIEFTVPSAEMIRDAKGKFLQLLVIMQDFTKSFSYMGAFLPVSNTDQASAQQQKTVQIMLDRLAAQFSGIKELQGLKVHDLLTGGEADWASKLSDVMGKMASAWGGLADNLTKMATAKFPTPDQMEAIKVAAIGILLWTADVIKAGDMPAVIGAEDFAAVLAAAAGALNSIAGLKLADITAVADAELTTAKENIRRVGLAAWEMVTNWLKTAGDKAARDKWITDLQDFSIIVGLATSILKSGDLGDLSKLAAVTADQLRTLGANIMLAGQWVYAMVAGPGGWLATAPDKAARQKWIDDLRDFEATISAAVSIVKASVIGEIESSIAVNIDAAKAVLVYVRDELVPAVLGIVGGWTLASEAAKAATERMQEFAGWIGAAIAIAKATEVGEIKSGILVKVTILEAILVWMRDAFAPAMQAIAAAWVVVTEEAKKVTEHMQAFAGWVGAAVSIAKVTEVGEVKSAILVKMNILTTLLEWMRDVFAPTMEGIAAAWKVETEKAKAMTERMGAFAGWIGAAVSIAKATEVGEVKAAILVKMNILLTILEWMRDVFAPAIEGVVAGWTMTTDAAKAMVERMTLFASVVKAAVDIAKSADVGALATVTSPADMGAKMETVKTNVLAMFNMIRDLAKDITLAEATARANLAEALGRAMKGLGDFGSGVTSLMDLAETKLFGSDPSGTGPLSSANLRRGRRADFFATQMRDTVTRAVKALQDALKDINIKPDDPKTTAISQLGEAFGKLADGLKSLAETKLPNAAQLAALVLALNGSLGGIGAGGTGGVAGVGALTVNAQSVTLSNPTLQFPPLAATVHSTVSISWVVNGRVIDEIVRLVDERLADKAVLGVAGP